MIPVPRRFDYAAIGDSPDCIYREKLFAERNGEPAERARFRL